MHHKQYMLTRVNPRMQWSTVGRRRLIMNSNIPKCLRSRKTSFFFYFIFYRPLQIHSHSIVQIFFHIWKKKKHIKGFLWSNSSEEKILCTWTFHEFSLQITHFCKYCRHSATLLISFSFAVDILIYTIFGCACTRTVYILPL